MYNTLYNLITLLDGIMTVRGAYSCELSEVSASKPVVMSQHHSLCHNRIVT